MKILWGAYRGWAKSILNDAPFRNMCILVETPEQLETLARTQKFDAIVLVGWSWLVPSDIVNDNVVVGMHPSDLPAFAGGSPIQNQILAGVEETNATLFRLNEKFDQGEIIDKEPISLKGHLRDVFASIHVATEELVQRFIDQFPNNTYAPQNGKKHVVKRLKPKDSQLPQPAFSSKYWCDELGNAEKIIDHQMTCKEMWDFIRCREDPYPNAFFEDNTGRLVIKWVEFEPK